MSDQCKHCLSKGDWDECQKTVCFHHENWGWKQLQAKVKHLESPQHVNAIKADALEEAADKCFKLTTSTSPSTWANIYLKE